MGKFQVPGIGSTDRTTLTLDAREIVFDTNDSRLYYGNGATAGGILIATGTGGGAGDGLNRLAAGTQTAGTLATVLFNNSNGITFGMSNSSVITASHNGLTTARASNDAIGLNTALTGNGVAWTVNSSGLSLNVPAFLTTAAQSNHSHNLATTTTNGSLIVVATTNSNGATFAVPPFLTTAQAPGAYLTTARASNDGVGLNTAQTNVTWTVNSNGISLNAGGYAGTGTSATNASVTLNSNGLAISVAAPGGGGLTNINVSAGTTSNNLSALTFNNANGITFGLDASTITASHNGITTARASNDGIGLNTAQTNVTWTVNSSGLSLNAAGYAGTGTSATNASVTLNSNGLAISVAAPGGGGATTLSGYLEAFLDRELLAAQIGNNQLFVQPMNVRAPVQFDQIAWFNNYSNATNSSFSATLTLQVGIYTRNNSTLSLVTSVSNSFAVTNSGTVGSYSIYGGLREYPIGLTTTLAQGNYFIGFLSRTTTGGGAGMTWSNFVASNLNSAYSGRWSSANNATNQFAMGLGSFNTTTTAIPNSIGLSAINGSAAVNMRPVIYKLVSQDLN